MQASLPKQHVVLLGAGHTNAHILRMWRMQPIPEVRLTCVSNFPVATYSGMLPGALAGLYAPERMQIDLVRLCAAVGAGLIVERFTGLDIAGRALLFDDRPPLPFDILSIGIGSVPSRAGLQLDSTVVEIKPMQTFLPRLESRIVELQSQQRDRPLSIAVVGGGVGGVEITMCLPRRLGILLGNDAYELTLINGGTSLAEGTAASTQQAVSAEFRRRGVRLVLGKRVQQITNGVVTLDDGQQVHADIVLWATSASAPPALSNVDLPKDRRGFLLTRPTLQTTADAPIFAVGDTGTIEGWEIPKAGVFAVRQGPVLWENIARTLAGRELSAFQPQSDFLKLLNLGDGRAIAEYKGLTKRGRWAWRLKDWIDGRFMDKYQDYKPMPMAPAPADDDAPMRCAGCGGKVSGSVLSQVLRRLDIPAHDQVLLGLDRPDDAAVIRPLPDSPITVTADFFKPPLEDPYLSGRIAALNSASDLFAVGAQPVAALALAILLPGRPRQQEQLLYELLAGSLYEFRRMDATLVGGHTIEGPEITIGFAMLANQGQGKPRTKADLRVGDALLLTKPLGTGVLLAAHMRAECRAEWMQTLLESMLLSNQQAASLINELDISALTDITGFGLAGHLLEMLTASNVACTLRHDQIPLLPGTDNLIRAGVESTLAPANRDAEAEIRVSEQLRSSAEYQVLFDPQTSGGLLFGVRPDGVEEALRRLADQSNVVARVIGVVEEQTGEERRIRVAGAGRA